MNIYTDFSGIRRWGCEPSRSTESSGHSCDIELPVSSRGNLRINVYQLTAQ
jgi:hypothetical protein